MSAGTHGAHVCASVQACMHIYVKQVCISSACVHTHTCSTECKPVCVCVCVCACTCVYVCAHMRDGGPVICSYCYCHFPLDKPQAENNNENSVDITTTWM